MTLKKAYALLVVVKSRKGGLQGTLTGSDSISQKPFQLALSAVDAGFNRALEKIPEEDDLDTEERTP